MRILIDMSHPGHVHLFKNFVREMRERGHEVKITARDKEITLKLLHKYGLDFVQAGSGNGGNTSLVLEWISRDIEVFKISHKFCPDILLGVGNPSIAHAAMTLRKPSVIFTDTEHAKFGNRVTFPFASVICTPSCYRDNIGPKQVRYNGYHELAYLHPKFFTPNPAVLTELGLTEGDPLIVVRFVSWQASHDIGQHGIRDKVGLVKALEQYGRVLITSEGALPQELLPYQIRVSPEKLHDLLYYATLYVGEGATTASECAVLGTHAIYVNSLGLGYIAEEDEKYHLVSDFSRRDCTDETVLAEARRLLQNPDLRKEGKQKGEALVQDKIDVTAFMVWFIEHYPKSVDLIRTNPRFNSSLDIISTI
ncbi:DUF354 domain-containing protein [Methanoculleus sp.]|uniref:DUF354 domain-containing protein n=1 Tax=Methanoculleus sp. TaxID=90427 RepID=UPI001BD33DB0|nr:DUF354 domain-containing protein [Methanoculleus sp.]